MLFLKICCESLFAEFRLPFPGDQNLGIKRYDFTCLTFLIEMASLESSKVIIADACSPTNNLGVATVAVTSELL